MSVYALFIRENTKDEAEMQVYSGLAGGTLAGHPVKVLAAYGRLEVLEGPPSEGVVILQFPTMEAAKAWYEGPAYQAAREHRFRGADYRVIFVAGM